MNKRFSTLMATALVAGSMAANATGPVRPYEFRELNVRANVPTKTINQIKADKWYQLSTKHFYKDDFRQHGRPHHGTEVLVQYRDEVTGQVYLRLVDAHKAPLNSSLWRLTYIEDGIGGGKWQFVNKETNIALMFDQTFAAPDINGEWKSNLMVNGCVNEWEWYNTDEQARAFEEVAPYAYFAKDSAMIMCRTRNGFIYSRKGLKSEIINNDEAINALKIRPVEAAAITLDEDDFNSMIDYNRPSWDQYGKFKFFEPNGDLLNPKQMSPKTNGVMGDDMAYQAECDRSEIDEFFEFAVKGFDGTADPREYRAALKANSKALDDLNAAGRVLNGYYARRKYIPGAVDKFNKAEGNFYSLQATVNGLKDDIAVMTATEGSFTVAKKKAEAIANATMAGVQFLGAAVNSRVADAVKEYSNITDPAKKVIAAVSLGNLFYDNYSRTAKTFNVDDRLKEYTAKEKSAVDAYQIASDDLAANESALTTASKTLEEAKAAYEVALKNYNDCEVALEVANKTLVTYNVAWEKTKYLVDRDNHFMKLQYMNDEKGNYLMVDTAFWQGTGVSPMNANLQLKHSPYVTDMGKTTLPIRARFFYNVTYYPTQDSLVVEPLNASEISYDEYKAKTPWKDSFVGQRFAYGSDVQDNASQASNSWTNGGNEIALKLEDLNTSGLCLTASIVDALTDCPLKTRLAFNNPYEYLTRTTLNPGLYFIKAKGGKNSDRFLVNNFDGELMYDVPERGIQDYNQMPATMWVVEKLGCEGGDLVVIRNREYGERWNPIFAGQLYADEDGCLFTINNKYGKEFGNRVTEERMLTNDRLFLNDDYEFIPVTNETALTSNHHGYGYKDSEALNYTNYAFRYNHNDGDKYINMQADSLLRVTKGADTYYELDSIYAPMNQFGYGAGVVDANSGKTLPQLFRQAYTLKVKDVNLVDNDTTYVAMNTTLGSNGYYIAKGIKDIRNGKATLAVFYLKNDQIDGDETCYAMIDTRCNNAYDHYWNGYRRATVVDGNAYIEYNSLNNYPNSAVSAFALEVNDRPLYRSVTDKKIDIYRTVGNVDQKFFEDNTNQTGASKVIDGFGYLGLVQEKMESKTDGLFVDPLVYASPRMPHYLLASELDSIPDGVWCNTNIHGYFPDIEAAKEEKEDETHVVFYNGYTSGRFLVNLADSVTPGSQAYHRPDLFTFNGYAVRLGFVEAVHMVITKEEAVEINKFLGDKTVKAGEFLYIVKGSTTLADLKNEEGYLIPGKLFDKKNTDCREYTTGKHNNWSFSFRLINDEDENNFFIESNLDKHSYIGSMTGSWVKIYNNCPVVNFIDGNHVSIEGSSLKADNIADGQAFSLTKNGFATSNDDVTLSTIKVIAKEGAVQIIGAAGKKVVINNVLGQTIAVKVLSSDDAQITVPAGVVVVAVEGEEAAKAIVR